jgi:hypothetical protein
MKRVTLLTALSLGLNLAALVEPKFAVFGVLLAVIALAGGSRGLEAKYARTNLRLGLVALGLSFVGLFVFAVREAVPGIAEARARDAEQKAVSRLRELLFAEDAMRRLAAIDPDQDGVGSAGFLSEMTGAMPLRNGKDLKYAPLETRLQPRVPTSHGPAMSEGGYHFIVCLPGGGGRYTARPGDPIDEELAERRWFAWAWPSDPQAKTVAALAIDQDEHIWKAQSGQLGTWTGSEAPPCDPKILDNPSNFAAWRGKQPRKELPGEK